MATYTRKIFLAFIDCLIITIGLFFALLIRFDGSIPEYYINVYFRSFAVFVAINEIIFYVFRLYKSLWQYASINELMQIFVSTLFGTAACFLFGLILDMQFPDSVYFIFWLITLLLIGGIRFSYRALRRIRRQGIIIHKKESSKEARDIKRVMVIGAGEAGSMVIKEMRSHKELGYEPVIAVDDDKWKRNSRINGVLVAGDRNDIKALAEKYNIDEIIVTIPSAKKSELSEILKICSETKCKLKTLPGVYELINERVSIKHIREVSIEDILGRDEIKLDNEKIAGYLKDETVLVTGGGGSIGSELCRQIAKFGPKRLIIFDIYENNAFDIQNELLYTFKNKINLEVVIGSIRDKERLKQVFEKYRPGVVFHAAAHKHVPLMEANPGEAVKNNVLGTLNTALFADKYKAKKFVLISTDKAVNPANIMGATKRIAEMIIQALDKQSGTVFTAVRFGNVLGSNGSVIPIFKKQIARGGPVTVTHPDIERYFMTIPEAAQLVIQAGAMSQGGEIFVLDMGKPVKIVELAKDLIRLSGFRPGIDIKIEFTGLRPGEKLYEELMLKEEKVDKTTHEKIFVCKSQSLSYNELIPWIKALEKSLNNETALKEYIGKIVTNYNRSYEEAAAIRMEVLAGSQAR